MIHLYLEDPQAAFGAFRKSFERCPVTEAEIQSAADALTGLIVRSTRESGPAQTLVDYLMFGSAGKDGKEGTADDVKDPSAGIMERIRWAAKQVAVAKQE